MAISTVVSSHDHGLIGIDADSADAGRQSSVGAVSWGAIFAGAAAAAALSLILLMLGVGLGLSSVSPWVRSGVSATALGLSTIAWLTLTQLLASGMGGYLAGRLRIKWVAVHTDEVYFRDTAHGFLAWAIAALATAALLGAVTSSILSGSVQATTAVVSAAANSSANAMPNNEVNDVDNTSGTSGITHYFVDALFRKDINATITATAQEVSSAEVTRILLNGLRSGALPAVDARYLAQLVAQRTGLSPPEAEKRVSDVYAQMQSALREVETTVKEAADKARKASATAALWLFVSLLIGAFAASFAATLGGRQRDA